MPDSEVRPFPWYLLRPYSSRFLALLSIICLGGLLEAVGLILLSGLLNVFLSASGGGGVYAGMWGSLPANVASHRPATVAAIDLLSCEPGTAGR